jgi:SAM-dependent methyltransferase
MSPLPNAAQYDAWNHTAGPTWVKFQEQLDNQLARIGWRAVEPLKLQPGERVLDVGCGAGSTTLDLARIVGAKGAVTGVDISDTLLGVAREREPKPGSARIGWVSGDAQTYAFRAGSFDAIYSRFGVMFFDDPEAAFANLRSAARDGARLSFCCWRNIDDNPWMTLPVKAAGDLIERPAPPAPGAPGPFAFADRGRAQALLTAAGWNRVAIEPFDADIGGAGLDATARLMTRVGPLGAALREAGAERDLIREAEDRVREAIRPYLREAGVFVPSATWIVTAAA